MLPSLRETEVALCESLLAGQRADLEGTAAFPHRHRTSRSSGEKRLSSEDRYGGLSVSGGAKTEKGTKITCACI